MAGLILLFIFLLALLVILYWGVSRGNDHEQG